MSTRRRTDLNDLGGFFRSSDAEALGIGYDALQKLIHDKTVARVGWGLYRREDIEPTENHDLAAVCARVPDSIVCLLSALQVHGIGTRVPAGVWLAVPNKARAPGVKGIKLRLVRFSGAAWTYGIDKTAFEGVPARITSPARTVLDCFRYQRRVGGEAAKEALHDALRQRKVTADALYRALDVLPSTRLRAVLEAMP